MSGTDTSRGGSMRSSHGLAEYPNHPLSVKKRFLTPFLPPNTVEEYAYDGLHRRTVKKKYASGSLSETRHYYYSDAWQVLEERVDNSGTLDIDRQFIWGLRYVDDLIRRDRYSSGAISETRFAMQDANFNVTAVTDSNGDVQERYRYDAYGTVTALDSGFAPTGNPPANDWETLYAGYRWDAATGLYLVRHRSYHAALGRWMQRDPISYTDFYWLNLYSYVDGNPITRIDPLGLTPVCCGPDVTKWFRKEVEIFRKAAQEVLDRYAMTSRADLMGAGATLQWASRGLDFAAFARKMDYKTRKDAFVDERCPGCPFTVTLAGSCMFTNQLGNIMYGIIAIMFDLVEQSRNYGRGNPNWIQRKLGATGPSIPWTKDPSKETAFDVGLCLQRTITGLPKKASPFLPGGEQNFGWILAKCIRDTKGDPIGKGTEKCESCPHEWDGAHTDFSTPANVDAAGNVPK